MTPDERRARMRQILDQHSEIARHFRANSGAFDRAVEAAHALMAAIRDANEAQREALDAMIAANEAALALWNDNE
jgi:hypothetical protein